VRCATTPIPLWEAIFERTGEQASDRQETQGCKHDHACSRQADANAFPARRHEQYPGKTEPDKKIGRQQQKSDAFRKDEEHHRVFFQAS